MSAKEEEVTITIRKSVLQSFIRGEQIVDFVKARKYPSDASTALTIPLTIVKKLNITSEDRFQVKLDDSNRIIYERVVESKG